MTRQKPESGDSRRDEVIAGEYVLGVLSPEDRRKVEARMATDRDFAAMVLRWQNNLATFDQAYELATRPARVFAAAEGARLQAPARVSQSGGLWNSLSWWRSLAIASLAAVAVLAMSLAGLFGGGSGGAPLVAELEGQGSAIGLVAEFHAGSGRLRLTPVAGQREQKSLELWLMRGDGAAISLGVLPRTGEGELLLPPALRAKFTAGSTLLVSVEPLGGSPTGAPTGAIVARGTTRYR